MNYNNLKYIFFYFLFFRKFIYILIKFCRTYLRSMWNKEKKYHVVFKKQETSDTDGYTNVGV